MINNLKQNFQFRLSNLNERQRQAVETIDGPVLVVAGPGSGKTELLSLRTANILQNGFVGPQNILLLTFTESGSYNMRDRLVKLIGEAGYRVAIYTFHAFAADIMNKYPQYFWNGATFRTATDIEKYAIFENILSKLKQSDPLSKSRFITIDNSNSNNNIEIGNLSIYTSDNSYSDNTNFDNISADNTEGESVISYIYMSDILSCITALKRSNINPQEFVNIINKHKEDCQVINDQIGKIFMTIKNVRKFDTLIKTYLDIYNILSNIDQDNLMVKFLSENLSLAIKLADDTQKSSSLTDWKNKYFKKSEYEDMYEIDDSRKEKIEKWLSLANVYDQYQKQMYNNGIYDFDDMIYNVVRELKVNITLRNDLEEKYQYIMIDEFQDTSDSQFAMIQYLTNSPVNEGSPNILAVGDDDQAIYKFQGAKLDNITKFVENFKNVTFITLDKNYRSTQNILDRAREVVTRINDRLENRYKNTINKNITAANPQLLQNTNGKIIEKSFDSECQEYDFVAKEIKNLINNKVDPKEISIIAKDHKTLKEMSKYLISNNINFSYQKKENCLENLPVKELINIVDFINSGLDDNIKDYLLPEILSYKFWGLKRIDIWTVAEKVKKGKERIGEIGEKIWEKMSWIEAMQTSSNIKVQNIANFLIHLICIAKDTPLEILLDKIIGTREWELIDEYDDNEDLTIKDQTIHNDMDCDFVSPFREYYFGKNNFDHNRVEYLDFLFALRTFIGALREYKQGEILYARDLPIFVSVHKHNSISLTIESPFATSDNAIVLQTAHKSKGLEYEYVFIINSSQKSWDSKTRTNKIGMPDILPILNDMDNTDDRIRLYFVAITRAKHTLYITHNTLKFSALTSNSDIDNEKENINKTDNNKEDSNNKEDVDQDSNIKDNKNQNITNSMIDALNIVNKNPLIEDEKILLKRLLENYKMPVTHLGNFLNFNKVGPAKFIEQNLLRFPQAMSAKSLYGSAMHEAMQNYYLYKNKFLENPEMIKVFGYFANALNRSPMNIIDKNKFLSLGKDNLDFYIKNINNRDINHILYENKKEVKVEIDMQSEGCNINGAELSGKIDKIIFDGDSLKIIDLKTGKGFESWDNAKDDFEKIKLHFFKYQLAYYYILLKRSRSYNHYKIKSLHLEFIEQDNDKIKILSFDAEDIEFLNIVKRLESLIVIVYNKIINLDFPDVSKYFKNKKGESIKSRDSIKLENIIEFEDDLLSGKI